MPSRLFTIEQVLSLLAETPPRLATLTADLTPAQLCTAAAPGQWSANEVLAHLRACADVWGNCIMTMLAEDHPTLRAVNPRTWIERTDYRELDFESSLRAFAMQRADLLAVLESLAPEDWSRTATLIGAGRPLHRTILADYADPMVRHERTHIKQIARIVKTIDNS